jgi:transcriptional regulator with GAF, ATPase, and Fis domain
MADRLAAMAHDLLEQDSLQATVDRIAAHTVDLVDGCDAAGILTLRRGQVRTLAATADVVRASDRIQGELGEGPCFNAVTDDQPVQHIPDLTASANSWPRYAPQVGALGIGSALGFRLFTRQGTLGALNLYSFRPRAFTEASEHLGWLLASHAAVAFAYARTEEQLTTALQTRHEIGTATGIVMERFHLSDDQAAFDVLKKTSQDLNIKLRDVARTILNDETIPRPPR